MEELRIQQPDIIGREAELAKLGDALDNAIAGRSSTVFITGEAGVGKTRLKDAFRDTVNGQKIPVLSGT
ncbi:MAG: ATP-binding protein, partial [Thermoplasmata archaeon]